MVARNDVPTSQLLERSHRVLRQPVAACDRGAGEAAFAAFTLKVSAPALRPTATASSAPISPFASITESGF